MKPGPIDFVKWRAERNPSAKIITVSLPSLNVISAGNNLQPATRDLTDVDPPHADDKALVPCSVGNARIEPRANSILVTKQANGIGKIDPLMALFDAVDLMSLDPSNTRRSVYETREPLVV